eukprot:COSAG06_NODE_2309_length_7109_cov_5.256205_1_plen_48_part_00
MTATEGEPTDTLTAVNVAGVMKETIGWAYIRTSHYCAAEWIESKLNV